MDEDVRWAIGELARLVEIPSPYREEAAILAHLEHRIMELGARPRRMDVGADTWDLLVAGYLVSNQDTLSVLPDDVVKAIGLEHPEQLQAAIPYVIPENYDRWQEVWSRVRAA